MLLLTVGMAGHAQRQQSGDNGLDEMVLAVNIAGPAMASLEMKQELELTEAQYAEVEALNAARHARMEKVEQELAVDPEAREQELKAIEKETQYRLQSILSEQQLRQLLLLEGRQEVQFITGNEEQ